MKKGIVTEKAVEFILTRSDEDIRDLKAKDVADALNTNLLLLSRAFERFQKISLSKFILREKLHRAYFILREDQDISIPELSRRLGFDATDQFEELFENYICVKPRQFQQILKQKNKKSAHRYSFPGNYETLIN